MNRHFQLLRAECVKVFGDIKIYWFNYLLGNLNVFFMFFGLFYAFSKNKQTDLEILMFLIGLMYWYFGVHAVDLISILIEEEIEQGTLEQLLMSRTHLAVSLFFRIVAQILFDLLKGVFVFALCMAAFGIDFSLIISWNFLLAVVVFFIGLFAMYGIGYMVAGVSLIYKQASSIASISSNLILFFTGATIPAAFFPYWVQTIMKLLPIYWSSQIIEKILLIDFGNLFSMVGVLFFELLLWIGGGVFCLNWCLEKVYEKGSSGNY